MVLTLAMPQSGKSLPTEVGIDTSGYRGLEAATSVGSIWQDKDFLILAKLRPSVVKDNSPATQDS